MSNTRFTHGLSGLRVMVTGGAGGIGAAVLDRLVAESARVMCTDVVQSDRSDLVYNGTCDVSDADSVETTFGQAVRQVGGIDALVTAAGVQVSSPTHELGVGDFRKVLDVNVLGTFLPTKFVIPRMLSAGGGRIVTFGSTAAVSSAPQLASYAAAKGAVLQYTRSIAVEYGNRGIRSNCICPGGTMTSMMAKIDESRAGDDHFLADHPIGRYADPSEIAAAVSFLLSDEASFMLGANMMVDGGYAIH